jgi:hypothetical protein
MRWNVKSVKRASPYHKSDPNKLVMWQNAMKHTCYGTLRHFQQHFSYIVYRGGQFYWWKKSQYPEKTIGLPVVD